jgi:predicted Zn-dependent peptidase
LQIGAAILGGLSSSRLNDSLVRDQQLAVAAGAEADIFAQGGQFIVQADVKPGQDVAKVGAALDAQIARLIEQGPTADELARAATVTASDEIRKLETTGGFSGKAPTLAEGLLYNGDAGHYRTELAAMAALTPQDVQAALKKWLSRPVLALTVEPGTRTAGGEARGGFRRRSGQYRNRGQRPPGLLAQARRRAGQRARSRRPRPGPHPDGPRPQRTAPIGTLTALKLPQVERATLSNGIRVIFARRAAVPVVSVQMAFDAGFAADPRSALGTQAMLLKMMDEGTTSLDAAAFARARERLGASISNAALPDSTAFQLDAMVPNLPGSLALLSDYIRKPALKAPIWSACAPSNWPPSTPSCAIPRPWPRACSIPRSTGAAPLRPPTGTGDPAVVKRLTRADLAAFPMPGCARQGDDLRGRRYHARRAQAPARTQLRHMGRTGQPRPGQVAGRRHSGTAPAHPADRPPRLAPVDDHGRRGARCHRARRSRAAAQRQRGSGRQLPLAPQHGPARGQGLVLWRGQRGERARRPGDLPRGRPGPDRPDRPSIAALRTDLAAFLKDKGVAPDELAWATQGAARELPGAFETSAAVLGGLVKNAQFQRPDDYYTRLAIRYPTLTAADLDKAARAAIDPAKLTWVVVGDAAKVKPQLDTLGLPVEVTTVTGK